MSVDSKYMQRSIQLALKGRGYTSPNPMVGAVVVYNNTIIGEGYHRKAGSAHAEVNAIASVKDKSLLKKSTIYASLEPCAHYGKTPPCAQLIIDSQIPKVVIGCLDSFPQVAGKGVKMLNDAGIETKVGVLEDECYQLNKEFNTVQTKGRPYIYLKWAQSKDGFMDKERSESNTTSATISNNFTQILVHNLRAKVDAIMVATNTAILDNPSLTSRLWNGVNPIRIILDRTLRIPNTHHIFDGNVRTYIITENGHSFLNAKNTEFLNIKFNEHFLSNLLKTLKEREIQSIMIEGGSQFLQSIIEHKMWDEAFVEVGDLQFRSGATAPKIEGKVINESYWMNSKRIHLKA